MVLKNKINYKNNNVTCRKNSYNNLILIYSHNYRNQTINANKTKLTLREYIKMKLSLNKNLEQNRLKQALKDYKKKSSKNLNNDTFYRYKIHITSNSSTHRNKKITDSANNTIKKNLSINKHSFSNLSNNYNIYFSKKISPIKPFYHRILIKTNPSNKNSIIVNDENRSINRNLYNEKLKLLTKTMVNNIKNNNNKNKRIEHDNTNSPSEVLIKNNILQKKCYYSNIINNQKIKGNISYKTNNNDSFNIDPENNYISHIIRKETLKTPNFTKFYIYNNNVDKLKFDQRTNNIFISEKSTIQNDITKQKILQKFNKYFNKKNLNDPNKTNNYLSKLEYDNIKLKEELIQTKLEVNLLQNKINNLTVKNKKINKFPRQDDNEFYKKKIKLRNDRVKSSNTCAANKKIPKPDKINEIIEKMLKNNINKTFDEDSLSYSFSNENETNENIPNNIQ